MNLRRLFFIAAVAAAVACTPAQQPSIPEDDNQENNDTTGQDDNPGGEDNPGDTTVKPGTYTIDFTQAGYANQEDVTSYRTDELSLEFTGAKWYDNGQALRFYSSSTVTVSSAKMIEKVVFVFAATDGAGNEITADSGNFSTDTWTGEAGKVVFKIEGQSGHRRVTSIEVTLGEADAPEQPGGDTPGGDGGEITPGEDVLTVAFTGVRSGGTYYKWEGKKGTASSAVYAGDTANYQDKAIQMNAKYENYGIITTASGGRLAKVAVKWNTNTYTGSPRILNVYGSNTAYTDASELYQTGTAGTLVGQITYTETTEVTVSGNYKYVGLRSDDGAMYFDEIRITWE